ncbi:hypothetical protein GCM10027174_33360 [Salinifilum aidingensis]
MPCGQGKRAAGDQRGRACGRVRTHEAGWPDRVLLVPGEFGARSCVRASRQKYWKTDGLKFE